MMRNVLLAVATLFTFNAFAFENEPQIEKEEGFHDIVVKIRISCPPSDEFQQFLQSIPPPGNYSSSFDEWKYSFIHNMRYLIQLVESENIGNSWWSVETDVEDSEQQI